MEKGIDHKAENTVLHSVNEDLQQANEDLQRRIDDLEWALRDVHHLAMRTRYEHGCNTKLDSVNAKDMLNWEVLHVCQAAGNVVEPQWMTEHKLGAHADREGHAGQTRLPSGRRIGVLTEDDDVGRDIEAALRLDLEANQDAYAELRKEQLDPEQGPGRTYSSHYPRR